ncbi:MAG: Ig-like domain-containing protein, partial [Clostridiales Family XIII bacterium]|nr:Ig-like domain-containing protein [Clostridiales Family XIII bacterium]
LKDAGSTQEQVDVQVAALAAAVAIFNDAVKYGTMTDGGTGATEYVNRLYLKNAEPDAAGKTHFVGEDSDKKYKVLTIEDKGKTVQLNGYYTTTESDGQMYETANSAGPLGEVLLTWKSSDTSVATVAPDGKITPVADGKATITATVSEEIKYQGTAPSKSVELEVTGQSGEYVKKVTIIDAAGNALSSADDVTTIIDGKFKFYQFEALVVWHDPVTGADRTEDTRSGAGVVSSTIKWSLGGSAVCGTINEDTGRFKSSEYSGNCIVQCEVTGGKGGKSVKDTAIVQVDTGEYAYKPASSLKLTVVYQEFPDDVAQEHTYALSALTSKLASHTYSYTILGGSRYGTIRAQGYLFKDVVALEGVDIDDVYQFRFTTADGYDNPITSKLLYGSGARYYFPNWDIGSRSGASVVPPMLATSSNLMWGESEIDPSLPLDDATRFRLVFGPLWGGGANSSYQIYYIQAVTIVLKGAPPADSGTGTGAGSGKDTGGGSDDQDTGSGSGSGKTPGGGPGNGSGGDGPGSSGGGANDDAGGAAGASDVEPGGEPDRDGKDAGSTGGSDAVASSSDADEDGSAGGGYRIFEMISNSKSSVAPINKDLPGLGTAIPIAAGAVAFGGVSFFVGFRRRLL